MGEVSQPTVIVGGGGHATVVADAIGHADVAGHLAPTHEPSAAAALGPYLGTDADAAGLALSGHAFAIGTGFVDAPGAARRARLLTDYGHAGVSFRTVCHPTAVVSSTAVLGAGVFVGARAVIGPGAHLDDGVLVNTGAVVDHDCRLGTNVHIAPGVTLSGNVVVGADTLIGTGASVRHEISIGSRSIVGVGAAVVTDVGDDSVVVGVPAREVPR
jgi:sugar O-acyltransferase (sialic acid O-acetyltransferase NeuD family)